MGYHLSRFGSYHIIADATYPTENTTDFNLKSVAHDCVHLPFISIWILLNYRAFIVLFPISAFSRGHDM